MLNQTVGQNLMVVKTLVDRVSIIEEVLVDQLNPEVLKEIVNN